KGAMPSNTKNKPSAANRSVRFKDTGATSDPRAPQAALLCARMGLIGILQVLEERPVRRHHQQIAIFAERMVVGLQAAVERVELGILRISTRVDGRGFGIALAVHTQSLALGGRQNFGTPPLGAGANAHTLTLT